MSEGRGFWGWLRGIFGGRESAWAEPQRMLPAPELQAPVADALPETEPDDAPGDEMDETLAALQASVNRSLSGADNRRIRAAFNASQPVGDRYELTGRVEELQGLVSAVIDGWNHAVIYGARGVGKTSLARVFGDLTDEAGCDVFYHSASGDAEFEQVLRPYLGAVAEAAGRTGSARAILALGDRFTARDVADAFAGIDGRRILLMLDEFDRITNQRTRAEIAALLKLLSDFRVPVQCVIVGISSDVDMLVGEHPSLRRHMVAVRVGPIARRYVRKLLEEGARRASIRFDGEAADTIALLSLGSPYHGRMFALNAALEAARAGRAAVDGETLGRGLDVAWRNWAGVSPAPARLFDRLARRPELTLALRCVAIVASAEYVFTPARIAEALEQAGMPRDVSAAEADAVLAALSDELGEADGRLFFKDSLAPQFLLLATTRADTSEASVDIVPDSAAIAALASSIGVGE